MPQKDTVEVLIADQRVVTIIGEPRDVFAVVDGLKHKHDPQIRLYDAELEDWTCWQPTRKAA